MSAALLDAVQNRGEEEREQGESRAARVRGGSLELSGGRRACELGREEGEGGRGQSRGVLRTSRHLDWREGEARGGRALRIGGGYSAGAHCSVLQSAQMAGMAVSHALWARPPCPLALGGSKQRWRVVGCSGKLLEEEGVEVEW